MALDPQQALDFERPLVELEQRIESLRQVGANDLDRDIERLQKKALKLLEEIFSDLSPWQVVQLSRHPLRPTTLDYIQRLTEDFVELRGDRCFRNDEAMVGGLARFRGRNVMVLGHQKGRGTKDNLRRNFGMARPEGYRKAHRLMSLANRLKLPILTFIDTPGAFPGIDAEERGQAEAIARNLELMATLEVPVIATVIGEGGSGGALALSVADRLIMLEYSIYAVISPEGCASILWRDGAAVEQATTAMKLRSEDLQQLGIIDAVIEEPKGGAHRDYDAIAQSVGDCIANALTELDALPDRRALRYQKFRRVGVFAEATST